MLNSISWQEFLTWLTLLAGGYYFISILLLYSQEFTTFFKPKPSLQSTIPKLPTSSVMGAAVQDNDDEQTKRSAVTVSEEIAFAEDDNQQEEDIQTARLAKKSDDLLVGTIADALEEIKTVINAIADAGHDKEQTSSLFQALLSRYSQLEGTTYQEAITLFIYERVKTQLPFSLSTAEVNAWWKSE